MAGSTVFLTERNSISHQQGDTIHIDICLYCRFSKEGYQQEYINELILYILTEVYTVGSQKKDINWRIITQL